MAILVLFATVKLNNQVNVKGEATTAADLTTGNIGVVSSQDGDNALLTVKLNKDINLGSTGSLTTEIPSSTMMALPLLRLRVTLYP